MELSRKYRRTIFDAEAIRSAFDVFCEITGTTGSEQARGSSESKRPVATMAGLVVERAGDTWKFDDSHEFLAEMAAAPFSMASVDFRVETLSTHWTENFIIGVMSYGPKYGSRSIVSADGGSRPEILRVMAAFDNEKERCRVELPPSPPAHVFIGHGRSPLWKDLKNHLGDMHHYDIEAYETGARAGHTIRDVLESMLDKSSFAILIMTGEDEQADGSLRARQNVVHEAGLFQGRLGFPRVAILLEEGVDEFSNIDGVQYIGFSKGNIRETYGDVLATLRREFG